MLKKSATPIEETPGEYGVDELDQKKPAPLNEKDKKDSMSDNSSKETNHRYPVAIRDSSIEAALDELNQVMPDE